MCIKFSVVIPLYNKESYVLKTLQSVIVQTYTDFEIIVIDDASTDNSLELVKQLEDTRIRIIEHEKNLGLSSTRNTGISAANNNYIAFLDADDCWHSNFLERIVMLVKKFPQQKVFATYFEENFNGKILYPKTKISKEKKGSAFVVSNFFELNTGGLILTQSCLVVHRSALENLKGYDSSVTFAEDIDFYIRCFSVYDLAYTFDVYHTQYTTIKNSLTQSSTRDKTYPDLKKYIGISESIDKFIYFYLYCFCQRLKLENNREKYNAFRQLVDLEYLTYLQALMLRLPRFIYRIIILIKKTFLRTGIQLTTH